MGIPAYHAAYVLDASVAAKWFVRHPDREKEKAFALRHRHVEGRTTLVIPEFALLELVNAIRYRPRATEADLAAALELLQCLHLKVEPMHDADRLRKANAIAWGYKVGVYDAAYVALAEVLGFPLITADAALLRRFKGHSIVLPLKDLDLS